MSARFPSTSNLKKEICEKNMQFLDASMIDLTTVSDTNLRKKILNESKTVYEQSEGRNMQEKYAIP
jgi:hypothetical protein